MHSNTSLMQRFEGRKARYSGAFLALAAACFVGYLLQPYLGNFGFYLTLFPSFAFAAWWCGLGPSVAAVASAIFILGYRLAHSAHSFHVVEGKEWTQLVAFLVASSAVVCAGEFSRRENKTLLRARGELEDEVRKRTAELDLANQGLSDLTARLLHLQDEERRRIARDLHDSVGQTLTVLGMNLASVEHDIERLMNTANTLKDSQELVRETVASTRTLSYLLHPPLLDEMGLGSALPWYTQGFADRSKISISLELPDDLMRLSRDSEVAIFRLVQECLTNIHRHSQSPSARIRVTRFRDQVCVLVEDSGKGISPEKLTELATTGTSGVGIRGMRERIRQLGGTLEINSDGIGKGTAVVARLPLNLDFAKSSLQAI